MVTLHSWAPLCLLALAPLPAWGACSGAGSASAYYRGYGNCGASRGSRPLPDPAVRVWSWWNDAKPQACQNFDAAKGDVLSLRKNDPDQRCVVALFKDRDCHRSHATFDFGQNGCHIVMPGAASWKVWCLSCSE